MPIDKTNKQALNQLQEQYKDEMIEYEYKHWKESYLAPPHQDHMPKACYDIECAIRLSILN